MSDGYTKLFSSIIHSTVWQEPPHVKIVWVTLLAMADQHGEVKASIPGLAKAAGVDIAQCEDALGKFQSPDPYSRTKDHEGRRIDECDGGWVLLNHAKYRHMQSQEDRKAKDAERQRKCREKQKALRHVTCHEMSRSSLQAEAEAEEKEEEKNNTHLPPKAKKKRRSRDEIVLEFSEGARQVVNDLIASWPTSQQDGKPIHTDVAQAGDRVDSILREHEPKGVTPEILIRAGRIYLEQPKMAFRAMQFFFGPGSANEEPFWRAYAKMAYRETNPPKVSNG